MPKAQNDGLIPLIKAFLYGFTVYVWVFACVLFFSFVWFGLAHVVLWPQAYIRSVQHMKYSRTTTQSPKHAKSNKLLSL